MCVFTNSPCEDGSQSTQTLGMGLWKTMKSIITIYFKSGVLSQSQRQTVLGMTKN